jgi:hypothetical protein
MPKRSRPPTKAPRRRGPLAHPDSDGKPGTGLESVRDLPDFHLRWPQFRPIALAAMQRAVLPDAEREVIRWLVLMADRIGKNDLR